MRQVGFPGHGSRTWQRHAATARRLRQVVRGLLLGLVLIAILVLGLLRSHPRVWVEHRRELARTSLEQRLRITELLEARLMRELGVEELGRRIRLSRQLRYGAGHDAEHAWVVSGDAPRPESLVRIVTVRLNPSELNIWLSTRLEEWLLYKGYQMPLEIKQPMFAAVDGRMVLGFAYRRGRFEQVFTAGFDLMFKDDGRAVLLMDHVTAGRMPVPSGSIGAALASVAPETTAAAKVGQWLQKLHRLEFAPVFALTPEVKARVLDHYLDDGGLTLLLRLEPRGVQLPPLTREQVAAVEVR